MADQLCIVAGCNNPSVTKSLCRAHVMSLRRHPETPLTLRNGNTLMNTLVGRKAAKTGDEAGITRIEQRILLASDFYLYDTPGMLWPKIVVEQGGYHLAASGAVGRNAYEEEETAMALLTSLKQTYGPLLAQRYKLKDVDVADIPALHDDALLTAIGKARGAWHLAPDANESQRGFLLNHLISDELRNAQGTRTSNSDPLTGQAGWYDVRVRIYPAGAEEAKESSPQFDAMKPLPGTTPLHRLWQAFVAGKGHNSGARE